MGRNVRLSVSGRLSKSSYFPAPRGGRIDRFVFTQAATFRRKHHSLLVLLLCYVNLFKELFLNALGEPPWRCSRKASAKVLLFSIPTKCFQEKMNNLCNVFALFDKIRSYKGGHLIIYIKLLVSGKSCKRQVLEEGECA